MTRLWIVRAGKQGDRELAAIEQGRLLPRLSRSGRPAALPPTVMPSWSILGR